MSKFDSVNMLIKPHLSSSSQSSCGICGAVEEQRLLHHVYHHGIVRRSFCPTCFAVYHPYPPTFNAMRCCKCYSSSHSRCRYLWTSVVAGELATLAFYVFTGYKFKPEAHNPYFVVDDEEEEAASEQLKLDDEFEL